MEDETPNHYFQIFKNSLNKETNDNNPTNYIYYGGDKGSHLTYWNMATARKNIEKPPHTTKCLCGHQIQENCYIKHIKTGKILVCGNCCIKRFLPTEQRGRTCDRCQKPHRNRNINLCNECKVEWHNCEICAKLCSKECGNLCFECRTRPCEVCGKRIPNEYGTICFQCRQKPCEGGCGKFILDGGKCYECRQPLCKCCKKYRTDDIRGFCDLCLNNRKRKCKICKNNSHLLKYKCCYSCYLKTTA